MAPWAEIQAKCWDAEHLQEQAQTQNSANKYKSAGWGWGVLKKSPRLYVDVGEEVTQEVSGRMKDL